MPARSQERSEFPAFGTTAVVLVTERAALEPATHAVLETVAAFDRACSRFRPDSEITRLNERAGDEVPVGPVLYEAVEAALHVARMTNGDVDPTIGRGLIALGYDRDYGRLGEASPSRRIELVPAAGHEHVTLDPGRRTLRLPCGVALDLGSSAKALAADRAAAAAHARARCGVLVAFGGDIALAGSAPAGGWSVRVTDDHRAGASAAGQSISLHTGGLASSSTTTRRWRAGGESQHHLLDPRTGRPAAGEWRTASVAAASCLDANAASTAAIVRGSAAVAWLESLGLPSRLVSTAGRPLHLAGWPEPGEELAA